MGEGTEEVLAAHVVRRYVGPTIGTSAQKWPNNEIGGRLGIYICALVGRLTSQATTLPVAPLVAGARRGR